MDIYLVFILTGLLTGKGFNLCAKISHVLKRVCHSFKDFQTNVTRPILPLFNMCDGVSHGLWTDSRSRARITTRTGGRIGTGSPTVAGVKSHNMN